MEESKETGAASHRRTPLQEPKVEESNYILMRRGRCGFPRKMPFTGPSIGGRLAEMEDRESNGSSTPRGMARWRPMAMDCHRSLCAATDDKSGVLGESADYQGEKGHIIIIIVTIIIVLSFYYFTICGN